MKILLLLFLFPLVALSGPSRLDIIKFAKKHHFFNPRLLAAIAEKESSLNQYALVREADGDYSWGLMQIKESTVRMLGFKQNYSLLFNWRINLKLAMRYLNWQFKRYGANRFDIVAAYNAGSVIKCTREFYWSTISGRRIKFPCTRGSYINQQHVDGVMSFYQ